VPKNYAKIAQKYAQDVVSGKEPACLYVKLACQRHLDDLKRTDWQYAFNPLLVDKEGIKYRPGDRVCRFLELLRHVKGEWRGRDFELADWQVFVVCVGFGWVEKETKVRRFREIYLEVPRKNGKSFLSAGLGLYMFIADQESGSEVYVGANGEHQANKVFGPAWLMCSQDQQLRELYAVKLYGQTPDSGRLGTETDYSKMERLIGNPKDGDMPSCYCCDEFHEHDTPFQYDTMRTGMGSRRQPMILITTTAGINKDGPCYEKRGQCINVLKGTFVNDHIFAAIYTIDEGDDWHDLATWRKANPNLGVSFFEDYVKTQLQEAEQTLSKQNIILCKNLNIWLDSYSSWLDMDLWRKCSDDTLREEDFAGKYPCYIGADFGAVKDLTARVHVYVTGPDQYVCFSRFNLPEAAANDQSKTHYLRWVAENFIVTNPGRTVDFSGIEDELFEFVTTTPQVRELSLDVGFSAWPLIQKLEKRLEKVKGRKFVDDFIVEYGKTVKNYSEPMKQLESAVIDGRLKHDGNPVLSWCMGNVVVRVDKKDNIFATKENADSKIDGADALITAFARAMLHDNDDYTANDGSLI
jgi:phage terminase large subunit-like protein